MHRVRVRVRVGVRVRVRVRLCDIFFSRRQLHIQTIEALIITHEHADAIMGMDDLRDVQGKDVLPVFCSQHTASRVQSVFPYLLPSVRYISLYFVIFRSP